MNAALEVLGISVQEVAQLLGVSVSRVYRLGATDETFPKPRKVGRARRHDPREVRAWFDAQLVEGKAVRTAAERKRLRAA
jgi:predicted DNA-binding transcriptional regulator AlpA